MLAVSKRPGRQKHSRVVRIAGIFTLSKKRTKPPSDGAYYVAKFAISFYGEDGHRVFERFGLTSIPEGRPSDFFRLQGKLKESLRSYLAKFGVVDAQEH